MEDTRVDGGGEEVVGRGDGVDVTGEVEVELVHRDHLTVTTASGAAFDTKRRSLRRLT